MKYAKIIKGKFISRPNRFVAYVDINGNINKAHVKNTGRCKELFVEGATVYLEDFRSNMKNRKLEFSIIAVEKNGYIINIDSLAPNKIVKEALLDGSLRLQGHEKLLKVQTEKTYKESRFDFYIEDADENKGFIEVKGVTLEENGICRFPDAPTLRGLKHLEHLIDARKSGFLSYIIFIIQLNNVKYFEPNNITHPEFGMTLIKAKEAGVNILAYDTNVSPDNITINKKIDVFL